MTPGTSKAVRLFINTNGTETKLLRPHTIKEILNLIGAQMCDVVNLKDGQVMIVDDNGISKNLPVNPVATRLYHEICKTGTANQIYGDVVIIPDADFRRILWLFWDLYLLSY